VTAMELSMEVLGKTNSDDDDGDNYNGTWTYTGEYLGGSVGGGKKGFWEVKRIEVLFISLWRQHNEPHQTLFEKRGGENGMET
jgi:hypothetical protein